MTLVISIIVASSFCSDEVLVKLDQQPGFINENLSRKVVTPRPDFDEKVIKQNLWFYNEKSINWTHCLNQQYWSETYVAEISAQGEKELLEAAWNLHNMCLELVDKVVQDNNLLKLFRINENLWPAVRKSWARGR